MIKCSVIIPVYKDWKRLQYCMDALADQTMGKDSYEILIVNNERTMKNAGSVNLPENASVLHQPRPGSYAARNKGAEAAKGKILAFTDSDCIPEKNWVEMGFKSIMKNEASLVGGMISIFGTPEGSEVSFIYDRETAFNQKRNIANGNGVTANLFLEKSLFFKLGGLIQR